MAPKLEELQQEAQFYRHFVRELRPVGMTVQQEHARALQVWRTVRACMSQPDTHHIEHYLDEDLTMSQVNAAWGEYQRFMDADSEASVPYSSPQPA